MEWWSLAVVLSGKIMTEKTLERGNYLLSQIKDIEWVFNEIRKMKERPSDN